MKIKNKYIELIIVLLKDLKLPIRESRMRTRFIKELESHLIDKYYTEKSEIVNEFANKDEEGNIIFSEDGSFTIPTHLYKEYLNEINALDNDILEISLNEQNKITILSVFDIITNDEYIESLSGEVAEAHDYLCEQCELAKEFYDNQDNNNN